MRRWERLVACGLAVLMVALAIACDPESRTPPGATGSAPALPVDAFGRLHVGSHVVETTLVAIGARSLPSGVHAVHARGEDVVVDRGAVVERFARAPGGIEQSWLLAAPPSEPGDLVVRVAIDGDVVAEDARGIVLAAGEARITYSHATFVDAAARRAPILARWIDGAIELRVPESVLAAASYPAVLDPTISVEHAIAEPVYTRATVTRAMRPVWNGTTFALFANDRVVHVSAAGTVMHPSLALPAAAPCTYPLFVTHDATGYWYVCSSTTLRLVHLADDFSLVGALDLGYPLPTASTLFAEGGGSYIMVGGSGPSLTARIFDRLGVSSPPITFASGAGTRGNPSAIWTGERFFVAYDDDRYMDVLTLDLRGTTIDLDGTVGSTDGVVIAGSSLFAESGAQLAPAPSGVLLAYSESDGTGTCTTRTRSIDTTGTVLATGVGSLNGDRCRGPGHGMFTGMGWLFHRHQTFAQFDVGGSAGRAYSMAEGPRSFSGDHAYGWGATTGLFTWVDSGTASYLGPWSISLTHASGDAPRVRPVVSADPLSRGRLVGSARTGVVAWYPDAIRRLGPDGVPIETSRARTAVQELVPVGDEIHLFTWMGTRFDVVRVSRSGAMSTVPSTASAGSTYGFASAGGDDQSVLLYAGYGGPGIYAWRFGADGSQLDATALRWTGYAAQWPDVARAGGAYFVAWEDMRDGNLNVYGMRVGLDGAPIDRIPLQLSSDAASDHGARVSALGDGWVVAWARDSSVVHRRVDATGTLGPEIAHALPRAPDALHVAWGGTRALLVWAQRGTNEGVAIAADGTAGPPFAIATEPSGGSSSFTRPLPSVASGGGDSFVVLYACYEEWLSTTRICTRSVVLDGAVDLGRACTSDAECAGVACVDGVCCNTPCGGGVADDCEACAASLGALADGVCSVVGRPAECRSSLGPCDPPEVCDGTSRACPADTLEPDGAFCENGDPCDGSEACLGGVCEAGSPLTCDDGDPCTADACTAGVGCTSSPLACDGGAQDAGGPSADAGAQDAGAPDAGRDAAPGRDARSADVDGGMAAPPGSGCACRASRAEPVGPGLAIALVLALTLARSRRRAG